MAWQPDYITGDQLSAYARIDDSIDDDEYALWATGASRAIDNWAGRQFGKLDTPAERVYESADMWCDAESRFVVSIDDLASTTGVTVNGTAFADTGAVLLPRNAVADGKVWTAMRFQSDPRDSAGDVAIVGPWGWPAVPDQVINGSYMQGNRFAIRRESPFGVAGSPAAGSELRLQARVDPDVAVTLAGLQRRRRAG